MKSKNAFLRLFVLRLGVFSLILTLSSLALPGLLAVNQASASSLSRPPSDIIEPSGGIVAAGDNYASGRTYKDASAKTPSCSNITYKGNAGAIHVQTSKNGYVTWGIYMYNPKLDAGPWNVDVYVGSRRVDHKEQDYAPHGSVSPKDAKPGKTFHITATHHATANGKNYVSVPNECIIP